MKKKILFLCTGNAARSQMAEGLANAFHSDVVEAVSAGSRPTGWVSILWRSERSARSASTRAARSRSLRSRSDRDFDVVVTVCDSAAADCPMWPGAKRIEHWPIEDPSWGPDDPATRFERFVEPGTSWRAGSRNWWRRYSAPAASGTSTRSDAGRTANGAPREA